MENNKLIAEFLGWSINSDGTFNTPFNWIDEFASMSWNKYRDDFEADKMLFHSDWNWLMLVVEKMTQGEAELNTKGSELLLKVYEALSNINITATFKACVEFIKWYLNGK